MDYDFVRFMESVKQSFKFDLAHYKEAQMKRRLISMYQKKGFINFSSFYSGLLTDPILLEEFIDGLTINVTEFFRNSNRWDILQQKILPRLIEKLDGRALKCWSSACSSGEEAYSLALLMHHHFPNVKTQITGTDLDNQVLIKAKKGRYTEANMKDCPEMYKKKYFKFENDEYLISQLISEKVSFRKLDLLQDLFDQNFDLILCRNVVIYFTEQAKDGLYKKISASLRQNGVLFVGSTEQIFDSQKYNFESEEPFFYTKKTR
jgi:chemotaxis protein methyltransferase CheR